MGAMAQWVRRGWATAVVCGFLVLAGAPAPVGATAQWVDMGPITGNVQGHVWSKVVDEVGNTQGRAEWWSLSPGVPSRIVVTVRAPNPEQLDLRIQLLHPDGDTGEFRLPAPDKKIPGGYQQVIDKALPGKPSRNMSAISKITVFPASTVMDQRYQLTVEIQPLSGAPSAPASTPSSASGSGNVEGEWARQAGGEVQETLAIVRDGKGWVVTGSDQKGDEFRRRVIGQENGWLILEPAANGQKGARIRVGTDGALEWESYTTSNGASYWRGKFTRTAASPTATAPKPPQQPATTGRPAGGALRNLALGRPAYQSSVYTGTGVDQSARHAVDGNTGGRDPHDLVLTALEDHPWWAVDLGGRAAVSRVRLFNRRNPDVQSSRQLVVDFSEDAKNWQRVYRHDGRPWEVLDLPVEHTARYVRVGLTNRDGLALYEVEVWGTMP